MWRKKYREFKKVFYCEVIDPLVGVWCSFVISFSLGFFNVTAQAAGLTYIIFNETADVVGEPKAVFCSNSDHSLMHDIKVRYSIDCANGVKLDAVKTDCLVHHYLNKYPCYREGGSSPNLDVSIIFVDLYTVNDAFLKKLKVDGFFRVDFKFFWRGGDIGESRKYILLKTNANDGLPPQRPVLLTYGSPAQFQESFLQYSSVSEKGTRGESSSIVLLNSGKAYGVVLFDDRCVFTSSMSWDSFAGAAMFGIMEGVSLEAFLGGERCGALVKNSLEEKLKELNTDLIRPVLDVKRRYCKGHNLHYDWVMPVLSPGVNPAGLKVGVYPVVSGKGIDKKLVYAGGFITRASQTEGYDPNKTTRTITHEKIDGYVSSDKKYQLRLDGMGYSLESDSFEFLDFNEYLYLEQKTRELRSRGPKKKEGGHDVAHLCFIAEKEESFESFLLGKLNKTYGSVELVSSDSEWGCRIYKASRFHAEEDCIVKVNVQGHSKDDVFEDAVVVVKGELQNKLPERMQDHYVVDSLIDRGVEASIYKILELKTGQWRAIRINEMPDIVRNNEEKQAYYSSQLLTEYKIAEKIKTKGHKHIVKIFDVFFDPRLTKLWVVMDFYPGSLQKIIDSGALTKDAALAYLKQMIKGLDFLHGMGVVHRDLKPQNVLLGHDGYLALCDFGLARLFEGSQDVCQGLVGNPAYFSVGFELLNGHDRPEEILRKHEQSYTGYRQDINALVVMYLYMRTKKLPSELILDDMIPCEDPVLLPKEQWREGYCYTVQFWQWFLNLGEGRGSKYFDLCGVRGVDQNEVRMIDFMLVQEKHFYNRHSCQYFLMSGDCFK